MAGSCHVLRLSPCASLADVTAWLGIRPFDQAGAVTRLPSRGHLLWQRPGGWLWRINEPYAYATIPTGVSLFDVSDGLKSVELTGPQALSLLDRLGPASDALAQIRARQPVTTGDVCIRLLLSQLSVTLWAMEDQFILLMDSNLADWFWQALLQAGEGVRDAEVVATL